MRMKFMVGMVLTALFGAAAAPAQADNLLKQAKHYAGLHEGKNRGQLKKLIGVNPSRTAWCGFFLAAVARQSGEKPPVGAGIAKSWTRYGRAVKLKSAKPGDVVILRNRKSYHVGILVALAGPSIKLLGGNQSNGVQVSTYSSGAVVAVRR